MLHVAVLFEYSTLNGGEQSMLAVLRQLRANTHVRFTAIVPPAGLLAQQLRSLNVPVVPFRVHSAAGIKHDASKLVAELQSVLATTEPDLLHANSLSMSRLAGQVRSQTGSTCCTGHIRDIMKLSDKVIRDLNGLSRIAVVSQAAKAFHEAQGLRGGLAQLIYNGVDTGRFCHQSRTVARTALLPQLPESARVLLNVGQICLRKGQLDLARAVVRLLKTTDDLHLVLLGERHSKKEESIAYERAIEEEFAAANRSGHLHRAGFHKNVEQWMNAADLLVHPARQEPLGRVLLEAAACELPVIATDVGGTSEIFQDEQSGILVPPDNIDALVNGIRAAFNDWSQCKSRAVVAADRIRLTFGIERAAASLQNFWQAAQREHHT